MSIDKQKLKELAQAVQAEFKEYGGRWPQDDDWFEPEMISPQMDYTKSLSPDVVLSLLAEIERLEAGLTEMTQYRDNAANHMRRIRAEATAFQKERDQIKAEKEALRKVLIRVEKCTDGSHLVDGKWLVGANVMTLVRRTLWPKPAPGGAVAEWQVPGSEANAAMAKEVK